MPYTVKKQGSQWVKLKHGKVVSHHATKEKAEASVRAALAGEHGARRKSHLAGLM